MRCVLNGFLCFFAGFDIHQQHLQHQKDIGRKEDEESFMDKDVITEMGKPFRRAGEAMKDTTVGAGQAIKDTAVSAKDKVKGAGEAVVDKVRGAGETVADSARDTAQGIKEGWRGMTHTPSRDQAAGKYTSWGTPIAQSTGVQPGSMPLEGRGEEVTLPEVPSHLQSGVVMPQGERKTGEIPLSGGLGREEIPPPSAPPAVSLVCQF